MKSTHDEIAALVLSTFERLPARFKPRQLHNGRREWVPIAGIVAVRGRTSNTVFADHLTAPEPFSNIVRSESAPPPQCVSIATGMKCLPRDKIALAQGNVLHDWHAEILAIRGFNRWVVDECEALTMGKQSQWLESTGGRTSAGVMNEDIRSTNRERITIPRLPFRLQDNTSIYMYISAAPCGDASMELTMAAQDDSTPWTKPPPSARPEDMIGRAHFDQLGVVRRKPSRPDAPSTWSKSCSDKLALKQCTGLLSSLASTLVEPIYISTLVLPEDQLSNTAVKRAWSKEGRMAPLMQQDVAERWAQHGYAFKPFTVATTQHEFAYKKLPGCPSSNLALMWTPDRQEALVNGVLMGRKQFDARGASSVSRRTMWQAVKQVAESVGVSAGSASSYAQIKAATNGREQVKDDVKRVALQGWRRNDGDDEWTV